MMSSLGIYLYTYEMAFYPPGLWGDGTKEHLPIGWFDDNDLQVI